MSTVINYRQIATILAALRHWRNSGMAEEPATPIQMDGAASEFNAIERLTAEEIDALCDVLSASGFRAENYRPKVAVLHDSGELGVLCDPEVEVERIATNNVRALVDHHREELFDCLGEKFRHLGSR